MNRKTTRAIVYVAINVMNGHKYIGITSRSLRQRAASHFSEARRRRHNGAFYKALEKYGEAAFEWFVVKECASYEAAALEEIRLIAIHQPEYNSTLGGDGRPGYRMSMAERQIRRERGKRDKRWEQYARLGPVSARAYGVAKSSVIELCNGNPRRKTVRGMVFRYTDDTVQ